MIPNLQPLSSETAPVPVMSSPEKIPADSARLKPTIKSPTKWYHNKQDSDDELATPKKELSFDIVASTPLFTEKNAGPLNISFSSPMSKLNNLHLSSQTIPESDEPKNDASPPGSHEDYASTDVYDERFDNYYYDDDDDEDEDEGEANRTISLDGDDPHCLPLHSTPPVFVNSRKRPNLSDANATNDDMEITNNTSTYSLKLSFSDSTPCPEKPKRKKLKFKDDSTPLNRAQTKHVLNLSSSFKTSANAMLSKLNDVHSNGAHPHDIYDTYDDDDDARSSPLHTTLFSNSQSTPISQSTPANSRAPSPPVEPSHNYLPKYSYTTPVNRMSSQFNYSSPRNSSSGKPSITLKQSYNKGDFDFQKYKIVGEVPVTSAGLMDEKDDDVDIADKRMNDPYLITPQSDCGMENEPILHDGDGQLRHDYMTSTKLPLLPPNYHVQTTLSVARINELLTKNDVLRFYTLIAQDSIKELLKQERVKWHPDKWVSRLKEAHEFWFDMSTVHNISQILNSLIEELSS